MGEVSPTYDLTRQHSNIASHQTALTVTCLQGQLPVVSFIFMHSSTKTTFQVAFLLYNIVDLGYVTLMLSLYLHRTHNEILNDEWEKLYKATGTAHFMNTIPDRARNDRNFTKSSIWMADIQATYTPQSVKRTRSAFFM
jgi:hypothetical protein